MRREKHAPDRVGANPAGGRADPLDSPDHHAATSGHDEEGTTTSTDVSQALSRDGSPQLEPIPVGKGNDDPQRREADVDEKEAGQMHSGLDPDIDVGGGSGPNQSAHSFPPSPSLPQKAEPDST